MMLEIEISNEQTLVPINESKIRNVAESVCRVEKLAAAKLSIAFVDNPTLRTLNIRHLQHDYDTDVLSFLMECYEADSATSETSTECHKQDLRGVGKAIEGEVVISAEMARDCAADFGWRTEDELVLYLVHGLLHLVGYDDLTESERELMRSRERAILRTWELTPHYAEDVSSSSDDDPPPSASVHETDNPPTNSSSEDPA